MKPPRQRVRFPGSDRPVSELLELYQSAPTVPETDELRHTLAPMLDGLSRALGYEPDGTG